MYLFLHLYRLCDTPQSDSDFNVNRFISVCSQMKVLEPISQNSANFRRIVRGLLQQSNFALCITHLDLAYRIIRLFCCVASNSYRLVFMDNSMNLSYILIFLLLDILSACGPFTYPQYIICFIPQHPWGIVLESPRLSRYIYMYTYIPQFQSYVLSPNISQQRCPVSLCKLE